MFSAEVEEAVKDFINAEVDNARLNYGRDKAVAIRDNLENEMMAGSADEDAAGAAVIMGAMAAIMGGLAVEEGDPQLAKRAELVKQRAQQLAANQQRGNTFRDQVAAELKSRGFDVRMERVKNTPYGPTRIDIEVSSNGKVLGGVECKTGCSFDKKQKMKQDWLNRNGYKINVIRQR